MLFDSMDLGTKYRDSVLSKMEKNYQLFSFYNTIELLAMSKFDYKNLPDGIYNELIERPFLRSGYCAMQNITDTTDGENKILVASTASAYKFATSVLGSVSDSVPSDEFDAISELERVSGVKAPAPLSSLKDKSVRFNKSIDKDDMKEEVSDFAKE